MFIKSAIMAQDAGSPLLLLAAWLRRASSRSPGALTYAELGAMLPHAGGEYVYLRRSYGELAAFLFDWMRFVVADPGSIAIPRSWLSTRSLSAIVPMGTVWAQTTYGFLGGRCSGNSVPRRSSRSRPSCSLPSSTASPWCWGGRVQTVLTILKFVGIAMVVFGIAFLSPTGDWAHLARAVERPHRWRAAFGLAMLAALWATTAGTTCRWPRARSRIPAATCRAALMAAWSRSW